MLEASSLVTKNRAEFERLRNDTLCIQAMAENYAAKVRAAELDLRYNYSHDIGDLERAEAYFWPKAVVLRTVKSWLH